MNAPIAAAGRLDTGSRLDVLLDQGSFRPLANSALQGGALMLGSGEIFGRTVHVHARDAAVAAGLLSVGELQALAGFLEVCRRKNEPVIGLFDATGCIDDAGAALLAQMRCLASIRTAPGAAEMAVVLGKAVGFDAMLVGGSDFVVASDSGAEIYIAGPERVRAVTGERLGGLELGGAQLHAEHGPMTDIVRANEVEALLAAREVLDLSGGQSGAADVSEDSDACLGIETILPRESRKGYAIEPLLAKLLDDGMWIETGASRARNLLTGLARLAGRSIGVIASRPDVQGGALDAAACRKAQDFVTTCRRVGLPVVALIDCPGFLPGSLQERSGLAGLAGKLARTMAATPSLTLVLRRGLGPAYAALSAGSTGLRFCWSGAGIGATTPVADAVAAGLADFAIEPSQSRRQLAIALQQLHSPVSGPTP